MAGQVAHWRTAVIRVIGDEDALAADVAARLGEPVDGVRATVRLWLELHRVAASTGDIEGIVDSLRVRAREGTGPWAGERRIEAPTLEELLAWATRETHGGRPDASLVVEVQRAAGSIAARSGLRLVLFLARLGWPGA